MISQYEKQSCEWLRIEQVDSLYREKIAENALPYLLLLHG